MNEAAPGQRWIWRDIQLELPGDWEMLQYSKERGAGRCAFADRHQFRFELDWRIVAKEPDMPRLLSDYRSKLEKEKRVTECAPLKIGGCPGFSGKEKGGGFSRFGLFFPDEKLLVEAVFLWPGERDGALEAIVLKSLAVLGGEKGGWKHWRAFGMEWRVPWGWTLSGCRVQPAYASLEFEEAKKRPNRLRFERYGMIDTWLRVDIGKWLWEQAPARVYETQSDVKSWRGIELAHLTGSYQPKGLLHANGCYDAVCWIEPSDGRLYRVERVERAGHLSAESLTDLLKAAPSRYDQMSWQK